MPRSSAAIPRSGCPISLALELLGDQWSLLIVRDLMFKNLDTFGGFQQAGEGIASNILSDRLERLERAEIIDKVHDKTDGRRFVYRLTPKGIDLAPTLVDLVLWSATYDDTDAPPETLKEMRNQRAKFLRRVRAEWRKSRA